MSKLLKPAVRAIFSTLLRDVYGSSEIIIGLCYLYVQLRSNTALLTDEIQS